MYPYYGQPPAPDNRYDYWPQYDRLAAASVAAHQHPWPPHGYYNAPSNSTGTAYGPRNSYQARKAPRSTPAPPPAAYLAAGYPYTGSTYRYHSAHPNGSGAAYGPQDPYQAHLAPGPTPVQAVTQPNYDPRVLPHGDQPYVPPPAQNSGSFHGYPPVPFHQPSGGYRHSEESTNPHGVVSTHVGSSGQHAPPSTTNEQHLQPGGLAPTSNERVINDGQVPSDWAVVSAFSRQDQVIRLDDGTAQDAFERLNGQQALGSLSRQHDGGFPPRQVVGGALSHQQVGGSPARRQVDGSTAHEQVNGVSPLQNNILGAPARSGDISSGTNNAEQSVESRSSTTSAPVEQALVVPQNAGNITPRGLQQ